MPKVQKADFPTAWLRPNAVWSKALYGPQTAAIIKPVAVRIHFKLIWSSLFRVECIFLSSFWSGSVGQVRRMLFKQCRSALCRCNTVWQQESRVHSVFWVLEDACWYHRELRDAQILFPLPILNHLNSRNPRFILFSLINFRIKTFQRAEWCENEPSVRSQDAVASQIQH